MKTRRILAIGSMVLLAVCAALTTHGGEKKETKVLVVVDHKGKENKLKTWKFTTGLTHLAWLADAKDKKAHGPEALPFREEKSTTYAKGIQTLIPLASVRKVDYDNDKGTVSVTVAGADGKDHVLTGSTKYKDVNELALEADVDLGELGMASVSFRGGVLEGGMKGVRFPDPKPVAELPKAGRTATVIAVDKVKHEVIDLLPLYQLSDGDQQLIPRLYFKTTVKVDVSKIKKLQHGEKKTSNEFRVTLHDGMEHALTLLPTIPGDEAKGATLVGLLGRFPGGYKLFPPHTITEVTFAEEKKEN